MTYIENNLSLNYLHIKEIDMIYPNNFLIEEHTDIITDYQYIEETYKSITTRVHNHSLQQE